MEFLRGFEHCCIENRWPCLRSKVLSADLQHTQKSTLVHEEKQMFRYGKESRIFVAYLVKGNYIFLGTS